MFGKQKIIQVKSDNFEFMLLADDVCTSIFPYIEGAFARIGGGGEF